MDPQKFFNDRLDQVKKIFTGQASPQEYLGMATYAAKLPAKPGLALGSTIIQSAGTRGAAPMSRLGISGDAPVYDTPFNKNELSDYEARVQ